MPRLGTGKLLLTFDQIYLLIADSVDHIRLVVHFSIMGRNNYFFTVFMGQPLEDLHDRLCIAFI